jgi:Fe-S oxidoreductase/coenzyme F420-reducing hydrogenase delta subunit
MHKEEIKIQTVKKKKQEKQKVFEPKVLVFACNWCSYAGADNAGVSRIAYSPNVRLLRTMCSGRVHPSFVLKAFVEGSDGVIVSGCHFGDCHYMFGNYRAEEQYKKLQDIVGLLGLEPERIALEWISAAEGPRFAEVINSFVEQIRKMGPSPFVNGQNKTLKTETLVNLKNYKIYECLECGRCTGICPVAKTHHQFSPRRILSRGISRGLASLSSDQTIWSCLTCKQCENVCPADIPYSEMNKKVRAVSNELNMEGTCTHGGVFDQISNLMTRRDIKQNRLEWVTNDLKISAAKSDTLFFTGCSPYFAAYFGEPYADTLLGSLKSAIKLMNKIGIEPLLIKNEICCGHDFLLRGEPEKFKTIAELLTNQIKNTNAKRIVFTCPECMVTLRDEYPKVVGNLGVELIHLSELIESHLDELKFEQTEFSAAYQDPCRLGRYSNLYNQPRNILNSIEGFDLKELHHNKKNSICCGNTAWISCDAGTKEMQNQKMKEVIATGSKNLLTACPKCFIHLTCAQDGKQEPANGSIKINDMWNFLGTHLQ